MQKKIRFCLNAELLRNSGRGQLIEYGRLLSIYLPLPSRPFTHLSTQLSTFSVMSADQGTRRFLERIESISRPARCSNAPKGSSE